MLIIVALFMLVYSRSNHMSQALHMSHSDIAGMLSRQRGSTSTNALSTLASFTAAHGTQSGHEACQIKADIVFAVVPTPLTPDIQKTKYSASHDRYVRLLQQILKVINNAHHLSVYLAILLDVDTLHPAHRQWCHSIPWCHLHLISNTSHATQVVDTMRSLRICTPSYLVMPDYVHIDAAFLLRLKILPRERVACLVQAPRDVKHSLCENNAFQLPSSFKLSGTSNEHYSIITSAVEQNLYAGNFDVVSVH